MRTVTWSNAFARSFKRWMRKRPDMHKDITFVAVHGLIFIQGAPAFVGIYQWHRKISIDGNMLMVYIDCY